MLCVELRRSAFSSVATRRNLIDQDIVELVYLTLPHIRWQLLEGEDVSAQSNSDTDKDTYGFTVTNFTQWTGNKNSRTTVPVVHTFTSGQSELRQRASTHQDRPFRT